LTTGRRSVSIKIEGELTHSINGVLMFLGEKYEVWKERMREYLMLEGSKVWQSVENGYIPPTKVKSIPQKDAKKNNSIIMEVILDGLVDSIKVKVGQCILARDIWLELEDLYSTERHIKSNSIKGSIQDYKEKKSPEPSTCINSKCDIVQYSNMNGKGGIRSSKDDLIEPLEE
jgi:hypothetical protein